MSDNQRRLSGMNTGKYPSGIAPVSGNLIVNGGKESAEGRKKGDDPPP